MPTQENAGEQKPEIVPVTIETQEVDWEAKAKFLEAENFRIEGERENYRKGMLKAKGYSVNDLPQNDENGNNVPSIKEVIKEVLNENEIEKQSRSLQEEQRKFQEDIIRENKILKEKVVSLNNKSQVGKGSPSGTGSESKDQKTNAHGWTSEQEASLRKKGVDPLKAWENLKKVNNGNIIG